MQWNWQLSDWPRFFWDTGALNSLEMQFLRESGQILGINSHLEETASLDLRIEHLCNEAIETSLIEGETLDRASVQSSIRRSFGISVDNPRSVTQGEKGIAELMVSSFRTFDEPLSDSVLLKWHSLLMQGQMEDQFVGSYRASHDPMLIVSGDPFDPVTHYEAPPSQSVPYEMERFIYWFSQTRPVGGDIPLPALTRSALAHLHFESIHPFHDGNGRIGRVIAEKVISQSVGQPILIALSQTIQKDKKAYYEALATTRFSNEVTAWIEYFGNVILDSISDSIDRLAFTIKKSHFFDRFRNAVNPRQEKVLRRIFREDPGGFRGGLSAGNYISITKISTATARRDLGELVKIGALTKTGERKGTRYFLKL